MPREQRVAAAGTNLSRQDQTDHDAVQARHGQRNRPSSSSPRLGAAAVGRNPLRQRLAARPVSPSTTPAAERILRAFLRLVGGAAPVLSWRAYVKMMMDEARP